MEKQTAPILRMTQARIARGMTKADLARRTKLDQSLVTKIELRRVPPYPGQLARIARVLKVRASLLMTDVQASGEGAAMR